MQNQNQNLDSLQLYLKIHGECKLNCDWTSNIPLNRAIIMENKSIEDIARQFTAKTDFSIDGFIPLRQQEHLIIPAISWLSENFPDVVYSPISKYFNPIVVKNNLSVNHCRTNIVRHSINKHHNLSDCNSVLEIGAGYGALAREVLLTNNKMKYVIIDLPESLMCSYSYLKLEFPEKSHIMLTEMEDLNNEFDILYVPVTRLNLFEESKIITDFDLFINTESLGEMVSSVVEKYYNLITNILNVKSVFWLNRFMNKGTSNGERDNICIIKIPQKWHIKHWEYIPKYFQCPYIIKTFHAANVEMYAEIKNVPDETNNSHIPPSNILFHLWNSVRLNPSLVNIKDLIEYLEKMCPEGEEIWYYKKLLENYKLIQND